MFFLKLKMHMFRGLSQKCMRILHAHAFLNLARHWKQAIEQYRNIQVSVDAPV